MLAGVTSPRGRRGAVSTTEETSRRDAVAEQLFQGVIGALETLHVYLGDRLGLYAALGALPDASAGELAAEAGISERYAREWLGGEAGAGRAGGACPPPGPRAR